MAAGRSIARCLAEVGETVMRDVQPDRRSCGLRPNTAAKLSRRVDPAGARRVRGPGGVLHYENHGTAAHRERRTEHWTIAPGDLLLDVLRREGYFGVKRGCETGECGACTVLVNGKPINSCLMFAAQAEGCEVLTIEGVAQGDKLDPLQEAFLDHGAVQCGFCTPRNDSERQSAAGPATRIPARRRCARRWPAILPLHRLPETGGGGAGRGAKTASTRGTNGTPVEDVAMNTERASRRQERPEGGRRQAGHRPPGLHRRHPPARNALRQDSAQPARPRPHQAHRHAQGQERCRACTPS